MDHLPKRMIDQLFDKNLTRLIFSYVGYYGVPEETYAKYKDYFVLCDGHCVTANSDLVFEVKQECNFIFNYIVSRCMKDECLLYVELKEDYTVDGDDEYNKYDFGIVSAMRGDIIKVQYTPDFTIMFDKSHIYRLHVLFPALFEKEKRGMIGVVVDDLEDG